MSEKTRTICFSKSYLKLPEDANGRTALLLDVHNILLEYQEPAFLEYDTRARDGTKYELPEKGAFLLLIFELVNGGIFTTMRRWTPKKDKYYRSMRGLGFEVVVDV